MKIIIRQIQKVRQGKWDELAELEKRWDALEARVGGFPPKRRSRQVFGPEGSIFVWEMEWESWDLWIETGPKRETDPECEQLRKDTREVIESSRLELYIPLP